MVGVVGTNTINKIALYTYGGVDYAVFGVVGGLIGSYDGTNWHAYNSGQAISNNAGVVSTDTVTHVSAGYFLIVGGSAGSWGPGMGKQAHGQITTDRVFAITQHC